MNKRRRIFLLILLSLFLFLCDASLKYVVYNALGDVRYSSPAYPYGGIPVFEGFLGIDFCINYVTNNGGAWGVFSSYPTVLRVIRIVIIIAGFFYAFRINKERKRDVPILLILIGASCNIFDCFFYGSVIDMFHFILWGYSFPVFNIADMMIFFGVLTLFVQSVFEKFSLRKIRDETQ